VIQNDFKNIPIRSCVNPDEGCFEMKENSSGSAYRSYSYPGNYHDYRRQALVFSRAFGGVLIIAVLAVLALDRLFLGGTYLKWRPITVLCLLFVGTLFITRFMARSLSRFHISSDDEGLTVTRGNSRVIIHYGDILAMEKVRIPGWWPLRADLKPRLDTVRSMIRIRLRRGPSITFVSGLTGEDELMERIRTSAGLEPEP
jgi:hypothetical protein